MYPLIRLTPPYTPAKARGNGEFRLTPACPSGRPGGNGASL